MAETYDAIIIGGGVMGASIISNLATIGMTKTVLLEKSTIGAGSTGRSSGAIRMHYSTAVNASLAHESLKVFTNFSDIVGGDAGFVKTGYMVFAPSEAEEGFRENISMQQTVGISTREIDQKQAAELAPAFDLSEDELIAWEEESGHADPSATALAYINHARAQGATIHLETPVIDFEVLSSGTHRIITENDSFESEIVIIATGPWTAQLLQKINISLPLLPTRHQVFLIRRNLESIPTHPGGGDMTNLIYFRPEGHDLTLVGNGNHEETANPDSYNQKYSLSYAADVWNRLSKRMPSIGDAELFTGYSGLYTSTPDLHPIIDAVDGISGLYICSGFSGHGFKLAPAVGTVMTELITQGAASTVDIKPLKMNRFADGKLNTTKYSFKVIA